MSPKYILRKNKSKLNHLHNNIYEKKMNQFLLINKRLSNRVAVLSYQNKELSSTTNSLLLQKLELENEKNNLRNINIQLTSIHHTILRKIGSLDQHLQPCVPALVTLSKYIPSMMESVHEMSKLDNIFNESNIKEKKERLVKSVKPMVDGHVVYTPVIKHRNLDLSNSSTYLAELTKTPPERVSSRSSSLASNVSLDPPPETNVESLSESGVQPYVRLKDVATLLKNSKTATNKNPRRRLGFSGRPNGEGPSWLHAEGNQSQNSDVGHSVTKSSTNYSDDSDERNTSMTNVMPTLVREETSTPRAVQADLSTYNCNSISYSNNSTPYANEVRHNESMTPETSMFRNITIRKHNTRRSSETSGASDNDSMSSQMSRRTRKKKIDYKEVKLNTKLRRDK